MVSVYSDSKNHSRLISAMDSAMRYNVRPCSALVAITHSRTATLATMDMETRLRGPILEQG